MKVKPSSVMVDDQEKALRFYPEVLGFVKKSDIPMGEARWLTVVSPQAPEEVELVLEPNSHPGARTFQRAIFEDGIPLTAFAVDDVQVEYERMKQIGVVFRSEPQRMGPTTLAVFDDTCGNLIQIYQAQALRPGSVLREQHTAPPPGRALPVPQLPRLLQNDGVQRTCPGSQGNGSGGDMRYVDGFVLPVPKKNVQAYRRLAQKAGRIWREHGALEYLECVGDDLDVKVGVRFPRCIKLRRGEVVVFSWILYKSRAHRDRVNVKVMQDPRLAKMDPKSMPFDFKRMVYGGFKVLVDL